MRRRVLVALALAGLAIGLYEAWIRAQREGFFQALVGEPLVGWVYIGAGLVAWQRRPDNRVGHLLTAAGFAIFISVLNMVDVPVLFALGFSLRRLAAAILMHLIISYPSGRLTSRLERFVVTVGYSWAVLDGFARVVTYNPSTYPYTDPSIYKFSQLFVHCPTCPAPHGPIENPFLLYNNQHVFEILSRIFQGTGAVLFLIVLGMIIGRWRKSSGPARRALAPAWLSAVVFVVGTASAGAEAVGVLSKATHGSWAGRFSLVSLLVPVGFLVGLLRMRLASAAVSELVVQLDQTRSPETLQDVLARTLKDPSLQIAFWSDDMEDYVDLEGRPVQLPAADSYRAVTLVECKGAPLAAMIHDPALADERELVRAVAAAASLGLENERLHAQVRAQLEEVRASRARLVEATDAERRRVERDLHDGAQQRLVSLSLTLHIAQAQLDPKTNPELERSLQQAAQELKLALSELRRLARGIYPSILTHQGLGAALEWLAQQAPLPVEVTVASSDRYPAAVEATAYFVICEALTNIAKYANASAATITVERADGRLIVQVSDDGIGGADPTQGSGLRGLADRVAALEGQLHVDSPAGQGTRVRAELPCG
jgi:signal transduction histidine kinase